MASPPHGVRHNGTEQLRVLVVDDDVDFAESLQEVLEPRGYRVALAHTSAAALKIVRDFDAQVALVDIRLDRDSGVRLIPEIRDARPGILCLMVTAYAATENAIEALKYGAYDYLRKPLDPQVLFATLDRCFERLRLEHEKDQAEENLRIRNQELEDLNARLKNLLASSKALAVCSQTAELSQSLLREFARNLNAQGGSFFVLRDDNLVLMHSLDPSHIPAKLSLPLRADSVFDLAIKNRAPVLIEDMEQEKDVHSSGWQGYRNGSLMVLPLLNGTGEIVGVVSLHNKVSPPFTRQDCELGALLASYGSETLRVTRLFEALRESEAKYRNILQSIDEGYFELHLSGRVSFLNESMLRILGCSEEELKRLGEEAKPADDVMAPVQGMFEQVRRSAVSPKMMDYQIIRKDGSPRFLELSTSPIEDSAGQLKGYRGVVRDVTVRRLAEQERQRLAAALENTADSVVIADRDGLIQYVNPAFETTTGLKREALSGQRLDQFLISKSDPVSGSRVKKALSLGHSWSGQLAISKSDKTTCEFKSTISPIHDPGGEVSGFVCINRDVTNEIILEGQLRQAQKMEAVGRLAGGVAHDFNNMLSVILGYSELIISKLNPFDPILNSLKAVQSAANRSADLTRQLLAFSRKQTITPRVINLNEHTKSMERLLTRIIGEDIDLEFTLAAELWPVYMDPAQIDQVLANLAVNSRDAMPEGGKLTVETSNITLDQHYAETHLGSRPGDFVMLAVGDTGCGMDSETLDHVFEPFFTTKPEGKGTGLGLSTVYGIAKQNEGFVNICSQPGRGTTVKLYIPRCSGRERTASTPVVEGRSPGGCETILLVEDEGAIREMAKTMLEGLGYMVLEAPSPGEAILICEKHSGQIPLLLTDVVMPNMNGIELRARIRAMRPGIRTLFISGYTASAHTHLKGLEKDANLLQKPFTLDALAKKVREALGTSS